MAQLGETIIHVQKQSGKCCFSLTNLSFPKDIVLSFSLNGGGGPGGGPGGPQLFTPVEVELLLSADAATVLLLVVGFVLLLLLLLL